MLTYRKLAKKPKTFRTFTGLTIEEYDDLYEIIADQYDEYEQRRLSRPNRINAIGQGRDFSHPLRERLLMLLMYYRLYITLELESWLFSLDTSNVWRNIRHLEPLVRRCIPLPKKVHKQTKKIGTIKELLAYYPEMKAFIDATEQGIPRPQNKRRRKTFYSGKKKRHTVKNQLMVNKKGLITHKTRHVEGKKHDSTLYRETHPSVPPDVKKIGDLGYLGCGDIMTPRKKPRGKERSLADRRYNRKLAKQRVVAEHAIRRMKTFRIMGEVFRNQLRRHDTMTDIVSGLVNFRVLRQEGMDVLSFVG